VRANCEFAGSQGDQAWGPRFVSVHTLCHGRACRQELFKIAVEGAGREVRPRCRDVPVEQGDALLERVGTMYK